MSSASKASKTSSGPSRLLSSGPSACSSPVRQPSSGPPANSQSVQDLQQLLSLIQQDAALTQSSTKTKEITKEITALKQFCLSQQNERYFSSHQQQKQFSQIFVCLVQQRLCSCHWSSQAHPEHVLRVLMCLRILMRDADYQEEFFRLGGVKVLSEYFKHATDNYLSYGDGPFIVDGLKEMTNIFQKLSAVVKQQEWLISCDAHQPLVLLLTSTDVVVLHCSLYALISLAQSPQPRQLISELNSIEVLLMILQEYDTSSKKLAASLLRLLCASKQAKEMIKIHDGVPILLSQLHSDIASFLCDVAWCLVQLSQDPDTSDDIRQMGGISLVLALLHDRQFVCDQPETTHARASAGPHGRTQSTSDETEDVQIYTLKSACCACLTELALNDHSAQQLAHANALYHLGLLILPHDVRGKEKRATEKLQQNAFRALRFLFSLERNRRLFKRIFPPDLFAMFIDIRHYNKDLKDYKVLVEKINSLPKAVIDEIRESIAATNQNKAPSHYIGNYAVYELLGTGGFGSVYKVKKRNQGQSYLAMKEINLQASGYGSNIQEDGLSTGDTPVSELSIMKEQMKHLNVVRYYKTFLENERLYIIMEFIDGAPLHEYFNSLKEKKEKFTEARIWHIFMQLVLALRYLHKEKRIVHRDLKPNNIMLGEGDKVTITDFGLAKHKRTDCSKMNSAVGTIAYWCPEIVKNEPYTEKSDIWSLGCILYQMCTLNPPFFSENMLTLASKIVKLDYTPIPEAEYSSRIIETVKSCMTVNPDNRPDILELSRSLVELLLVHLDNMKAHQVSTERKLERERKRTQKHFSEACSTIQKYHRLCQASQERQDKYVSGKKTNDSSEEQVFYDSLEFTDNQTPRPQTSAVNKHLPHLNNDRGWSSDEESYPSSGNESRESSAGSLKGGNSIPRQSRNSSKPPPTPKSVSREYTHQLSVDISHSVKSSRDSGFDSGDPSPSNLVNSYSSNSLPTEKQLNRVLRASMYQRSHSTTTVDAIGQNAAAAAKKTARRPLSANTLTISPHRVRQISDPILQMLHQLHKIIYISQLPPTLCPNARRRVIERFKRALFAPQTTSFNLKSELKKLLQGSRDFIDLNLGPLHHSTTDGHNRSSISRQELFPKNADVLVTNDFDPDFTDVGLTYEQMQSVIETTLVESGYYDMSPTARSNNNNSASQQSTSLGTVDVARGVSKPTISRSS